MSSDEDTGDVTTDSSASEEESGDDQLPEGLRDCSFGELVELREKIGTKKFDAVYSSKKSSLQSDEAKEKKQFTRTNKNRPVEKSSKQRVSAFKDPLRKKKVARDPRFDDLSGKLNPDLFQKSYDFIESYQSTEKKELRREAKRTRDPNRKLEINTMLSRLDQQERRDQQRKEQQAAKRETRKHQQDLIKQGKKPFYLKKSDQKKLEIATKFAELKKTNKLDKFSIKKRKRNASRDRRKLPTVD
ncbi:ribosomal RNA processing protein 36 homolog [Sycon ciliatum]|uniref:ribosomal RNA processing protein 36 homolog n=1 Tax=Sycon ciliatum TaxID=27933 RepID=UPI0031F673B1|eukprot:scpid97922/ scgid25914/ Ribosomal RNA processing protein 36 homolog